MPDDRRGVCREPDSQGEKSYGVRGMKMRWENGRRPGFDHGKETGN